MLHRIASSNVTATTQRLRLSSRAYAAATAILIGVVAAGCGSGNPGTSTTTTVKATPAVQLFNAGLTAETEHNYAQAVSDFTAAIALDPTDAYADYDLGIAQTNLGHTSAAAAAYRKAITINPKFSAAMFNLADLLTPTAPATAISLFKKLERIDPKDSNVEFNLGLLLEAQGQVAAGEAQLKAALTANPALKSRLPKGTQLSPGTP